MPEPQRFELAAGQRATFAILAAIAVGFVVAGVVTGDGIAVATGGFIALLVGFIGRQAFGRPGAYLIDADAFRHLRGDEVLLAVPWDQVKQLGVFDALPRAGRVDHLAFDVADLSQVVGAQRYRNTRKLTGHDIVVNLGPLGGRSGPAVDAARAAWLAATGPA